jgi:tyrosyl-tRNA synthetase
MSDIVTILENRGLLSQSSLEAGRLAEKLAEPLTLYAGFDPTADSLHIGHLLQIMVLSHFQRCGHRPIALVGGATAMIGDPSGKSEERNLLDEETIAKNAAGIKGQLEQFLDFGAGKNAALLVNNVDWIGKFGFVEFLRDVGKHFRVGEMMGKESVRKRLQSETGMSFTEFSYQMLQSYDFLHLFREEQCRLQIGGDDQWGNITAGIDLVRKMEATPVYGLTSPLITKADGQKFGKTEGGAVWLDPLRTSPYDFYQYWIRSDDRDVIKLLKFFTFLTLERISDLEREFADAPEKRQAQTILAEEVTRLVHGEDELKKVQKASRVLFGEEITGLSDHDLHTIFSDVSSSEMSMDALKSGIGLIDALHESRLCRSRREAKDLIKNGGAYVNNQKRDALEYTLTCESLASESVLILRSGKKKYHLVRFT